MATASALEKRLRNEDESLSLRPHFRKDLCCFSGV